MLWHGDDVPRFSDNARSIPFGPPRPNAMRSSFAIECMAVNRGSVLIDYFPNSVRSPEDDSWLLAE